MELNKTKQKKHANSYIILHKYLSKKSLFGVLFINLGKEKDNCAKKAKARLEIR